jgi:pyridoxal 5'-phosphate synthase pdxT subunit
MGEPSIECYPISPSLHFAHSGSPGSSSQRSFHSQMSEEKPTIGVLALQGDVPEHVRALERAGARAVPVKTEEALESVDGLVIPGGESTTVGMLLERYSLMEPLRRRIEEGLPVFGTCTGLILMAKEIEGSPQPRIGCMDVAVQRNAYGRQVDSFESDVEVQGLDGEPVRAVFIRAPRVTRTAPEVEVLAETDAGPVLVRQGNLLGATFHPELTQDSRIHTLFVEMTKKS